MSKFDRYLNDFIIPLFMLFVCSKASLFHENLTYIANVLPYRYLVFILAVMISYHYHKQFIRLIKKLSFHGKLPYLLVHLFSLFIPLAAIIPYSKNEPLLSKFHVWVAFGGSIVFILLLNIIIWYIMRSDIYLYQNVVPYYLFMISGCFILFVWFGSVNSLLEIFFIFSINLFIKKASDL